VRRPRFVIELYNSGRATRRPRFSESFRRMDRRSFLLAVAAAAATARAAPGDAVPVVAVLAATTPENFKGRAEALRRGLRERGLVEGKTVRLEWRYGNGKAQGLDDLAQKIAALKPAVAVADSSLTVVKLRQAAAALPIVMATADDPVASRFVESLEKPGREITGVASAHPDEILKAVAYIARVVPRSAVVAALLDQNNATYRKIRARFRHAALEAGLQPVMIDANQPGEIPGAIRSAFRQERAAGLVVMSDPMFYDERRRIVQLVGEARRPAIYPDRAFVEAGGLMSYGGDVEQGFARAAEYVERILRGTPPRELPVQLPKEYRLVVNRRTARAMNVALPPELLKQASQVVG
jgi:putative ABC transport system substrate-binding protein